MKKVYAVFVILVITQMIPFVPRDSFADDPEARQIMDKVGERKSADSAISEMEMILIDKNEKERVRQMITYSKKKEKDSASISFFIQPPDVKGTGFLSHTYGDPNREDDQWLYIPSLKKTKRISAGGKGGSFMGSDFSYADLGSRKNEEYDYSFYQKREMDVDGQKCWVLYVIPRTQEIIEKTGYTKSIVFVRQDNYFIVRGMFYMKDDGYVKYMDVKKLELQDGLWTAKEIHMTKKLNKDTEHKTILKNTTTRFNVDISDDLFTIRSLEKGP